MKTKMHLWVIVGEDTTTGEHFPFLPVYATKREAKEDMVLKKASKFFNHNVYLRVVEYLPVWDIINYGGKK